MEAKETKKKKRAPRAYYYPNGVKTVFKYERTSEKLSKIGIWMENHPDGCGEILDMRAVLK